MQATLDGTARRALAAACEVQDAGPDDHVDGVLPSLVARPASTEQVSEALRAASAHRLTVVPRGRGTKLSWGMPPSSADVLLDLSAMGRVLDHAAGDLIVATQAGARLSDVQDVVAQGGQQLAVDETLPGASVGGSLATNASGPRRMATGTMRDLLIGITVVRADGIVAKAGGRVVKNVAGYDLGKLMVGSYGTLAVVTEALFRLHPLPEAQRWVTATFDDARRAHEMAQAVVHAQVVPTAVEVDWPTGDGGRLHVLLEGRPEGAERRAQTVQGLLGGTATTAEVAPRGWASYPWTSSVTEPGAPATAVKLTCVLSGVGDVLAAAHDVGASVRGSAGTGVLYAAVTEREADAVRRLREVCARRQGAAVVLDAPSAVKQDVDVWGPIPALDLMRRVKDQLDPDRRLSPGRFVGGL
jgi:glycolate oxidase FAD binding subunit